MNINTDLSTSKRLFVGDGTPYVLGLGPTEITGSAYIEGPTVIGTPSRFPNVWASSMIGPLRNKKSPSPIAPGSLGGINHSPYSLAVLGSAAIGPYLDVALDIRTGTNVIAQGEVMSFNGAHLLSAKKNFDIPHPNKPGWRLRHTCLEGPSNDVFIRGKLKNDNKIHLPSYWENFIDYESITVSLTPIGKYQKLYIKKIKNNVIYLNKKSANCYYHIYAERIDGEKLIPEYIGNSPKEYPGNNDEYSVSGYHYDIKK